MTLFFWNRTLSIGPTCVGACDASGPENLMDEPLQALDEIQQFLIRHYVQYVVIGGIANAIWGRPRVTLDADLKVLIGQRSIAEFVELLSTQFRFRVSDVVTFVRRTYVVPLYASNGVGLDMTLYEQQ